jgi:DNA-binding CsgD family transcriptional regulator
MNCILIALRKTILIYGSLLALLVFIMKFLEYKYFMRELSAEFYITIIAIFFTGLGIWLGLKFTRNQFVAAPFTLQQDGSPKKFDLSKREFEVLLLINQGLSNQEIAEKLFVSISTVKTHTSNLFAKLDVKRRTQAIQKAKEIGLLL